MIPKVRLPDCGAQEVAFSLSAAEKRELVLRIAEEGEGAIDAFIREKEAQGDGLIAAKIRRLKEELLKRAEELREKLAGGFRAREAALEEGYAAAFAELETRRKDASERLERMATGEEDALSEALRGSELVNLVLSASPPSEATLLVRFRRILRRVLRWLLAPLRWLLSLFAKGKPAHDKRVAYGVAVPGRLGLEVESRLGDAYLSNPTLRRRVKERLRAAPPREKIRRAWERLLGRADYDEVVRRAMEAMLAEEADQERRKLSAKRSEIQDALSRLADEEEERRARRQDELERLREEREREAERIERELVEAPERALKQEIVDELRMTGLLKERSGKLLPTLQFMDAFAAVVYAEETRNLASGEGGATGAYAEAVGNFVRGPMRTGIEVSHMDIPASLARARQRHPHVRRMTDDDVLVYREEREALQHVVIVLDRSGSMEENERMEAAKRAALALHHAVKQENPRNRVDLVMMDTSVKRVNLVECWEAEPRGFTNTGAALRLAREILDAEKSERGLVYLVTDGLPEAYTVDGEDVAGRPEPAMEYAVKEAKRLRDVRGLGGFVCLLLEAEDDLFVESAEKIADVLNGRVLKVDPASLAGALIKAHRRGAPRMTAP